MSEWVLIKAYTTIVRAAGPACGFVYKALIVCTQLPYKGNAFMNENIKAVLDHHGRHLKFDVNLLKKIHQYRVAFANRNADHSNFFGGNYFGVYPIRFKVDDRLEWTDGILGIDDYAVRKDIIELPTVNEEWVRGTDVMNLSCCWLTHRFAESNLSDKLKHQVMVDCQLVFQYKLLTSLMTHYFSYPTDESTALAVYAALSRKFALKRYGTWQAMLEARSEDIIAHDSIHFNTIKRFNSDEDIQYMVTDIQGRLRAVMKKMYEVFLDIKERDAKILQRGGTIELEGKTVVRDVIRDTDAYKRYMYDIMIDKSRWVKTELVEVICSGMKGVSEHVLTDALNFMTESQGKPMWKKIEEFSNEVLLHAFEFIQTDQLAYERSNDIQYLITRLRANYMSNRSTDPSLLKMRDIGQDIVKKAITSRNPSTISAVRTSIMLYIVLRVMTRKHYG